MQKINPKVLFFIQTTRPIEIKKLVQLLTSGGFMWSTPKFEDLRLGFEVTLYISNRSLFFIARTH